MTKISKAALAALMMAAATATAGAALAQPHGGGARGGHVGGRGGFVGGHGGYRGYGYGRGFGGWGARGWGGRGWGGPYWGGYYGFAPWGWYPPLAYYPGYAWDYYDYAPYPAPLPPPAGYYPPPEPEAQPPEPPQATPEPPPAPRAPAAYKEFIVYFPFDDALLTQQAMQVVHDAARYAARFPGGRVTIVGYTDAAGSEGYNQTLSEHRSQSVRETLMAEGLDEDSIDMAWKGKHDLAVQTPDGVRQAANRRVTIVVHGARGGEAGAAEREGAPD